MAISALSPVERPEAGSKSGGSKRASGGVAKALTTGGVKVGAVAASPDPAKRLRTRRLEK